VADLASQAIASLQGLGNSVPDDDGDDQDDTEDDDLDAKAAALRLRIKCGADQKRVHHAPPGLEDARPSEDGCGRRHPESAPNTAGPSRAVSRCGVGVADGLDRRAARQVSLASYRLCASEAES
jgi:hypothetical protein